MSSSPDFSCDSAYYVPPIPVMLKLLCYGEFFVCYDVCMKRLFLASSGLEYIKKFIGHKPSQVKMLFIPTAGNLDEDVWWIDKDRDVLSKMGFCVNELDIAEASTAKMQSALANTDIVYVAGGNTFYLLKQIRETRFDKLLTDYVEAGGLYAGASAGALVAGVDIESVASIDEP